MNVYFSCFYQSEDYLIQLDECLALLTEFCPIKVTRMLLLLVPHTLLVMKATVAVISYRNCYLISLYYLIVIYFFNFTTLDQNTS